jgi:hypothetical protein
MRCRYVLTGCHEAALFTVAVHEQPLLDLVEHLYLRDFGTSLLNNPRRKTRIVPTDIFISPNVSYRRVMMRSFTLRARREPAAFSGSEQIHDQACEDLSFSRTGAGDEQKIAAGVLDPSVLGTCELHRVEGCSWRRLTAQSSATAAKAGSGRAR